MLLDVEPSSCRRGRQTLASVQDKSDLSLYVAQLVYGPAPVAYVLALVHYEWLSLIIVALFSVSSMFQFHLFRNFPRWPTVSKLAAFAVPAYVALGFILPIDRIGWWFALPVILYLCVAMIGWHALRSANIER